jgi:hypothetical protein
MPITVKDANNSNQSVNQLGDYTPSAPFPVAALPPNTAVTGTRTVTTAGTPVSLGTTTGLVSGVTVKSLGANTQRVFLRATGSSSSFELKPGESTILFISTLAIITVDAEVNGEGVTFHGS